MHPQKRHLHPQKPMQILCFHLWGTKPSDALQVSNCKQALADCFCGLLIGSVSGICLASKRQLAIQWICRSGLPVACVADAADHTDCTLEPCTICGLEEASCQSTVYMKLDQPDERLSSRTVISQKLFWLMLILYTVQVGSCLDNMVVWISKRKPSFKGLIHFTKQLMQH